METLYGEKNVIPEITRVVDTITGRTAEVYKLLPGFGVQVWVKERGYERENWAWWMVTLRQPRRFRRWPRPIRFPRAEPTQMCHCKIGKLEVENLEERKVICTRCKKIIAYESFPNRIEKAEVLLRETANPQEPKHKVQKRVVRRKPRKAFRKSAVSRKGGKVRKSRVGIQSPRRSHAKRSSPKSSKNVKRAKNRKKGRHARK